jgi:hypothetical protein
MKKNILKLATSIMLIVMMSACNDSNSDSIAKQDTLKQVTAQIVGNDVDEKGCKGSAGYQWSILKNKCIRLFEDGIRLDAKQKGLDTTVSAFIVFKAENIEDSVELYLPTKKVVYVLVKDKTNGAGKWTNDTFELQQWKGMFTLENKSKKEILYQGTAVK